jgi:hypothetical protein
MRIANKKRFAGLLPGFQVAAADKAGSVPLQQLLTGAWAR